MWRAFEALDDIWAADLANMHVVGKRRRLFPLLLFFDAHMKVRLAAELGFSRCIPEAHSVLRTGIEAVAYAFILIHKPEYLSRTSYGKAIPASGYKITREALNRVKQEGLFSDDYGLGQLHDSWKVCSRYGSHETFEGLSARFRAGSQGSALNFQYNYLDPNKRTVAAALAHILNCASSMEEKLFEAFRPRLELDHELLGMRNRFTRLRRRAVAVTLLSVSSRG